MKSDWSQVTQLVTDPAESQIQDFESLGQVLFANTVSCYGSIGQGLSTEETEHEINREGKM